VSARNPQPVLKLPHPVLLGAPPPRYGQVSPSGSAEPAGRHPPQASPAAQAPHAAQASPAAQAPHAAQASPAAQAPHAAQASPAAAPAWPQAPAISSQPQARWFLQVQAPPLAAPGRDLPVSAAPVPAPGPSVPAAPAPSALVIAPEVNAAAAASGVLAGQESEPEAPVSPAQQVAESVAPAGPATEPTAPAADAATPEPAAAPEVPIAPEGIAPPPAPTARASSAPPAGPAQPASPAAAAAPAAPVVARFAAAERERPLPSIERALSGPGSRGDTSWRRQVKIVTGGQGPGQRDQETLDRDRARLPLDGARRITILGCTRGAGQTVTALMTGYLLAAVRGVPVAALDLNPGSTSLAARRAPAGSTSALLAARNAEAWFTQAQNAAKQSAASSKDSSSPTRFDVIADPAGLAQPRPLEKDDYQRLADLLTAHYPLTMIDPAPTGLTRVLAVTDQLVLVAPASPDAATSLANTQQWLTAHGYEELTGRAVTVINGVSRRTMDDVRRAESAARGRCRAIVRVPWDDLLSARPGTPSALHPQTKIAYTALAGVLVAGMAAVPVPGRNPGEHSD
jgi:MinD-like ATPase involved in chromosome partitioning or flagellar assembly